MEKKIKSELMKMSAIMVVLVGLGIYAREFVIAGLQAKLALNSSIFILAGFAAWLAFKHVLDLRNEATALKALQVDYGSIRRRPTNPYRHPAIVFKEPELLGQGYRMITEEFSRNQEVKISNATVQTLLHDVDQRINDRRSTLMYFAGLMVFLGLLGAFMGLMKTVHAVSDLIGAMDLSGSSGTEGMAKMIEGMKAPLNGMSVGFSSSLFGLMTSMVLGALERFMTSAMKALRNDFEHWLSNLANLEGSAGQQANAPVANEAYFAEVRKSLDATTQQLQSLCDTVSNSAESAVGTREAMGELARAMTDLSRSVQTVQDPAVILRPMANTVAELAHNQIAMLGQFRGVYEQSATDRLQIRAILDGVDASIGRMNSLNGVYLHKQLDNLAVLLSDRPQAASAPNAEGAAVPVATASGGSGGRWLSGLFSGGIVGLVSLRRELRRMVMGQRRMTRDLGVHLDDRLSRIEAGREVERAAMGQLLSAVAHQSAQIEALSELAVPTSEDGENPLVGARMEMDVLRRRLAAEIDESVPPLPPLGERQNGDDDDDDTSVAKGAAR